MTSDESLLLAVWRDPSLVRCLSSRQWGNLLWEAGHQKCLARTSYHLEDAGCLSDCPATAQDLLACAHPYPAFVQVRIAREIRKIHGLLRPLGISTMLLKGGAYLGLELPFARGRSMNDLDIMVQVDQLESVEQALTRADFRPAKLDDYDQRYYRRWMHELPPMRHGERGIEVDVHHRILPLTSRLNPEPGLMWQQARELARTPGLYTLAPSDMLLHAATHLFYDGEVRGGLKDLLDIDGLVATQGGESGDWQGLLARAAQLDLGRPLYYGLRFSAQLLGSPVPDAVIREARTEFGPGQATDRLMGRLVPRVLAPTARSRGDTGLSGWLLYVRSHWLRMPPWLLAGHLSQKLSMRIRGDA